MEQSQPSAKYSQAYLARLRKAFNQHFDSEDLQIFCFDLQVDYDSLRGDSKAGKTMQLIRLLVSLDRLPELIALCAQERPNVAWSELAPGALTGPSAWEPSQQHQAAVAAGLRADRLPAYLQLWALFEPLARYARPGPFTYADAWALSEGMRRWYFQVGGIFLSERSRTVYFELRDALKTLEQAPEWQARADIEVPAETFTKIQQKASNLRTTLAEDLGTR